MLCCARVTDCWTFINGSYLGMPQTQEPVLFVHIAYGQIHTCCSVSSQCKSIYRLCTSRYCPQAVRSLLATWHNQWCEKHNDDRLLYH